MQICLVPLLAIEVSLRENTKDYMECWIHSNICNRLLYTQLLKSIISTLVQMRRWSHLTAQLAAGRTSAEVQPREKVAVQGLLLFQQLLGKAVQKRRGVLVCLAAHS